MILLLHPASSDPWSMSLTKWADEWIWINERCIAPCQWAFYKEGWEGNMQAAIWQWQVKNWKCVSLWYVQSSSNLDAHLSDRSPWVRCRSCEFQVSWGTEANLVVTGYYLSFWEPIPQGMLGTPCPQAKRLLPKVWESWGTEVISVVSSNRMFLHISRVNASRDVRRPM